MVLHDPKLIDPNADNDYDFVKSLKSGAQGDCTLIRSKPGRELYVVKRVKDWDTNNNPHEWRKEMVYLLKFLKPHTNLLRPYAFDRRMWVDQRLYFEYCSGGDLHSLISFWAMNRIDPSPAFLLHSFIHLVDAFAYLHASLRWDPEIKSYKVEDQHQCIIHGDVKTDNILLRWPGEPGVGFPDIVLCDFGLSRDSDDIAFGFAGTPGWFAPEIQSLLDQKKCGAVDSQEFRNRVRFFVQDDACDIYGLGLVMGTMFEAAFLDRKSPSAVIFPKAMRELKFPSLVTRCLEPDPEKRWGAYYDSKRGMLRHVEECRTIMDGLIAQGLACLDYEDWGSAVPPSPNSSGIMELDDDE